MKKLGAILKSVRYYFVVMMLVFTASLLFGYHSDAFHGLLNSQIEELGKLAEEINDSNHSLFWFIFFNNSIKSVIFMYAGLLLGLLPFLFVFVNGMLLGYVVYLMGNVAGAGAFELIVKGLLPHGIIEIPIILLAAAYGLMLGVSIIRKLFSLNKPIPHEPVQLLKQSWVIVVFMTVSLLIAAFIEAYITTYLLQM